MKFTVFDYQTDMHCCANCVNKNCISGFNNPRKSLDGTKAIVTGEYKEAPGAQFLTQAEAIRLMESAEWSEPVPDFIDIVSE